MMTEKTYLFYIPWSLVMIQQEEVVCGGYIREINTTFSFLTLEMMQLLCVAWQMLGSSVGDEWVREGKKGRQPMATLEWAYWLRGHRSVGGGPEEG